MNTKGFVAAIAWLFLVLIVAILLVLTLNPWWSHGWTGILIGWAVGGLAAFIAGTISVRVR